MTPEQFSTCAYCPRLCRHVCPVAVVSARESATPTAMATVALLSLRGAIEPGLALAGTELCAGCGACERHCYWHIDVSSRIAEFREQFGAPGMPDAEVAVARESPSSLPGFRTCWEGSTGVDGQLACCGARSDFMRRQPELAESLAREVVARMDGAAHQCNVSTCADWLRRHGANIEGPNHDKPTTSA